MKKLYRSWRLFGCIVGLLTVALSPPTWAQDKWTFAHDIELVSKWNIAGRHGQDTVRADLFRPTLEGRIPAAVIINSSGGVNEQVEPYYARVLAAHGVAALMVDSFMSRQVRRTSDDQSRVDQSKSDADAIAGFRWLAGQPWVDPSRIIVLGMSRGGEAALKSALLVSRHWLAAEDIHFAAHVAIVPGGCGIRLRDARTTGAPIFFMLAELDDITPTRTCLAYADSMRAAGNVNVRTAVYYGVYHAYELAAGINEEQQERWRNCLYDLDNNGRMINPITHVTLPFGQERAALLNLCVDHGPVTTGGDAATLRQATTDLLHFLGDSGIIEDREATALLPDCTIFPRDINRRNCRRARAGWTGDLVAIANFYRSPGPLQDNAKAARVLKLAADRDSPRAQWKLADMYRQGIGVSNDAAAANALARSSAAAGQGPAMNILGVMALQGSGQPASDTVAADWFEQAAEMRNDYALANLGRMYAKQQAGLSGAAEAVRLWRLSAYYDGPLGRYYLGEALEFGNGVAPDKTAAADQYRAAARQDFDPDTKRRALAALVRIGQPP